MDTLSLKNICTTIGVQIPHSVSGMLWAIITTLWPWYWFGIVIFLVCWIVFEIKTRNGTVHYNSKNGFSPPFNSFVGSGTYLCLQGLVYLFLTLVFGDAAYCFPWSYALHLIVFLGTGHLLHVVGFWPELRTGSPRRRRYSRRKIS